MIRLIIADSHPAARAGVREALAATHEVEPVAEVGSLQECLLALATTPADVIVLDVAMDANAPLSVIRRVKQVQHSVRLVVFTAICDRDLTRRVFRAGANGFVSKSWAHNELVEAIRRVHSGELYISGLLPRCVRGYLSARCRLECPHERLSDREFEVLLLFGQGLRLSEIAARIGVRPKTVSSFRSRILHKLSLRTGADIIRYAVEHGLLHAAQC